MDATQPPSSLPLCVDLDGTLINTDATIETILKFIKEKPWLTPYLPMWFLQGKAVIKRQTAQRTKLNATTLPYNQEIITWLKEQKKRGRKLILTTATDEMIAHAIADHLHLFDNVIGSNEQINQSGKTKAATLEKMFGAKKFTYIGNSSQDIPVWEKSATAIIATSSSSLIAAAKKVAEVEKIFPKQPFSWSIFTKTVRMHQWVKNTLLFIPLLSAHQLGNTQTLLHTAIGFISFSALASTIYIGNDLMDVESDRVHTSKKNRPLAAGTIEPALAIKLALLLIIISYVLTLFLPPSFALWLLAYLLINVAYSIRVKQVAYLDVIVLASLYVLRIFAGSAASGIKTSNWLFLFALCFFTSLALVKRFTEITKANKKSSERIPGRGYTKNDKQILSLLGILSAALSIGVLAFYVTGTSVHQIYARPTVLALIIPLVVLWLARVWVLAYQDQLHEDPISFAIKDAISYLIGAATIAVAALAT